MAFTPIFDLFLRTLRICIFFVASILGVFPSVRHQPMRSLGYLFPPPGRGRPIGLRTGVPSPVPGGGGGGGAGLSSNK